MRCGRFLFALITLISWLYLDNFDHGVVWVNGNTVFVGIMFAVTLALNIFVNIRNKKNIDNDADEDDEEYYVPGYTPV